MVEADRLLNGELTGGRGGFGASSSGFGGVGVEPKTADLASDSVTSAVLSSNFGAGGRGGNGGGGVNVAGFTSPGKGGFGMLESGGKGGNGGRGGRVGVFDVAEDPPVGGAGSSFSSQFGRVEVGLGGVGGRVGEPFGAEFTAEVLVEPSATRPSLSCAN